MIGFVQARALLKSVLGSDFTVGNADVPIYYPGAIIDRSNPEYAVVAFTRDGIGRGEGSEMVIDVYVSSVDGNTNSGANENRCVEVAGAIHDAFYKRCIRWDDEDGNKRIIRTKPKPVSAVFADIERAVRRQVVVKAITDEESARILYV